MKRVLKLATFLVITLLIGLFFAFSWLSWQQANQFVFLSNPPVFNPQHDSDYEEVEFLSADGLRLRGWFKAPSREDGATILYVHGHGGNRRDFSDWAEVLGAEGYGALLFDLRARGQSEGRYTTMGVNEADDVIAAFNFLAQQGRVNPERIAIFGHSMGGATAILAAAQLPQARLVIASASYSSIRNALNDRIPTTVGIPPLFFPDMIVAMSSYLSGADYSLANPLAVVGEIEQPMLFITGDSDMTVPPSHSQILYEAANEPKELHIIAGANHNDMYGSRFAEYFGIIQSFLERHLIND